MYWKVQVGMGRDAGKVQTLSSLRVIKRTGCDGEPFWRTCDAVEEPENEEGHL